MKIIRKSKEELTRLCDKFKVDKLWSFSRFNCFRTSPYEYYLRYIKKEKEDRQDCIYGAMGGFIHDTLESFYNNEIEYTEMYDKFLDSWNISEMSDLKFDRNNKEKNDSIGVKYKECLTHFIKTHNVIPYRLITEQFVTIKVGNYYFQGYVDACYKDDNGILNIVDWKTSSMYKGDKAIKESAQLLLYAQAFMQMGIPKDKIKCKWNFLKYCTIEQYRADGKTLFTRDVERNKIGSSIKANAKMWLKKFEIENIDDILLELELTNNIECLPKEVLDKYKITDCYVEVDLSDKNIQNLNNEIINVLDEIYEKEKEYQDTKDESLWYDTEENVIKQSYYFANLCGYSGRLHKPYGTYLDKYNAEKELKEKGLIDMCKKVVEMLEDDLEWLKDIL